MKGGLVHFAHSIHAKIKVLIAQGTENVLQLVLTKPCVNAMLAILAVTAKNPVLIYAQELTHLAVRIIFLEL
jgi:hypothetical protein